MKAAETFDEDCLRSSWHERYRISWEKLFSEQQRDVVSRFDFRRQLL